MRMDYVTLKPSQVRFMQDSIHPRFRNGNSVNGSIREIEKGLLTPDEFPPIEVFSLNKKIYSLDNRRRYVFRVCEYRGLLKSIRMKVRAGGLTFHERSKFTTKNEGITIVVRRDCALLHYKKEWFAPKQEKIVEPRRDVYRQRSSTTSVKASYTTNVAYGAPQPVTCPTSVSRSVFRTHAADTTLSSTRQTSKVKATTTARYPLAQKLENTRSVSYEQQVSVPSYATARRVYDPGDRKEPRQMEKIYTEVDYAIEYSKNLMRRETTGLPISLFGEQYFYDEDLTTVSSDEDDQSFAAKYLYYTKQIRVRKWLKGVRLQSELDLEMFQAELKL